MSTCFPAIGRQKFVVVIESFLAYPQDSKVEILVKEGDELVLVRTYNSVKTKII